MTVEGEHYRYVDASIAPRPAQQPMPLWIGGSSPAAIRRVVRYGNGWLAGLQSPEQVAPVIAAIKDEAQRRGARIPDDHYGASLTYRFGSWDEPAVERAAAAFGRLRAAAPPDPRAYFAVGDAAAIRSRIAEYEAAGASKFVLRPIAEGRRRRHGADPPPRRRGPPRRPRPGRLAPRGPRHVLHRRDRGVTL